MDGTGSETLVTTEGLFSIARRHWWLPLLCALVGAGVAGAVSHLQHKRYQASAQLLFRNDSNPDLSLQAAFGVPSTANAVDPAAQSATNVALVSLDQVADRTAKALDRGLSGSDVKSEIAVSQVGQSNIVTITATDRSPVFAATLATTFARQFIDIRSSMDRSLILSALQRVHTQLASLAPALQDTAGKALRAREQDLQALADLQNGDVQLAQSASIPTAAALPHTTVNIGVGAGLGLLLGFGLALLAHRSGRRVSSPAELAQAYDLPLLSVVPQTRGLVRNGKPKSPAGSDRESLPIPIEEAFRELRTRLWHLKGRRELLTLLVTSAARGEGKSTTAWQLARAVARHGRGRVLLLEADLRDPTIAATHGLRSFPGLADALRQNIALEEIIQTVDTSSATVHANGNAAAAQHEPLLNLDGEAVKIEVPESKDGTLDAAETNGSATTASRTMDVMVAGAIPPNPSELMDSDAMSQLIDQLSKSYDCVILDAPPAPVVTDTLPLIRKVSGVIVVSSIRHASRDAAEQLRRELESLNAPLLGIVVNNAKRSLPSYYRPIAAGEADLTEAQK